MKNLDSLKEAIAIVREEHKNKIFFALLKQDYLSLGRIVAATGLNRRQVLYVIGNSSVKMEYFKGKPRYYVEEKDHTCLGDPA